MYHSRAGKTACFSPRQRLQMASFYRIALFPLPLVMKKKENCAMSSFVLIGDLKKKKFSSDLGCTFCLLSLSVVCYLSLRAFERASFMLLSSRWRDGDKNLN